MADDVVREGGCLCGQVRFQARGRPTNVRICHCRLCQTVMGKTARHPSSPELWRVFCPTCGTRLFAERPSASRVGIALAAFDDPNALPPECHFFVSSKIGWVRLNDDLPQYPEWPPG